MTTEHARSGASHERRNYTAGLGSDASCIGWFSLRGAVRRGCSAAGLAAGLFVDESGVVGFKTEYHRDDPVLMEVFCVDTGEVYWGGADTTNKRAAILVFPASPSIGPVA